MNPLMAERRVVNMRDMQAAASGGCECPSCGCLHVVGGKCRHCGAKRPYVAAEWLCPKCGSFDWKVVETRFNGEVRDRQRVCKSCHSFIETKEVPVPNGFKVDVVPITNHGG